MGTKTKSFVRSLRNNGLKLLLDVQDVCVTVSKDGLSTGTENAIKQLNTRAVRHSLRTCQIGGCVSRDLHRGSGTGKGQPCTLQQVSRVLYIYMSTAKPQNSNTASLEMFMAQIQSKRYSKHQEQGQSIKSRAEGPLYRENSLRPFLKFITPKRNKASAASSLFLQVSSAVGLSNTLL